MGSLSVILPSVDANTNRTFFALKTQFSNALATPKAVSNMRYICISRSENSPRAGLRTQNKKEIRFF